MSKEPVSKPPGFPCPGCGFIVFSEPSGSYAICPLCDWEDDHVQLKNPGMRGGANKESLYEHQLKTLKAIRLELVKFRGFVRDSTWRLLRIEECEEAAEATGSYYWKPNQS